MSIPIQNIYFLLCYASDALAEMDQVDVGHLDGENTANLLAAVLAHGVQDLMRRGPDREYVEIADDLFGLRGRIDFGTTARRLLIPQARTHCRFDELSFDIPLNQIIKETIRLLAGSRDVESRLRDELHALWQRLGEVSERRMDPTLFERVRLHRNNSHYRLLLDLCRLVHESALVDEDGNLIRFVDFSREEGMNRLFERFVRRFLQLHAPRGTRVSRRTIPWQSVSFHPSDAFRRLPYLETDVVVEGLAGTEVIDTKYYSSPLAKNERWFGDRQAFHAENINQMFVYVTNFALAGWRAPVRGLILFAATDTVNSLRDEFILHGHTIRVATLNLAASWEAIEHELLSLVGWRTEALLAIQ